MDEKSLLDHENAERILEEGWRLFQQKGYRGVTVDEVYLSCGGWFELRRRSQKRLAGRFIVSYP